ncbi:MAG TPA: hypothetical protein VFZ00_25105 [Solirubrobacter sp.]|nr:hypothetical protein [Solirubrobacter sp.]
MRSARRRCCACCACSTWAEHRPRARYFEQPGDNVLWLGDTDAVFAEIEDFLAGL